MASARAAPPQLRRVPRRGVAFAVARLAGALFIGAGLLLVAGAAVGFGVLLLRLGPTLLGSLQSLDQQMAGLVFLTSLGALLIFPLLGVAGAAGIGLGLALRYVGSEPAPASGTIPPATG